MARSSPELTNGAAERGSLNIASTDQTSIFGIEGGESFVHAMVASVREPLVVLDRSLRVVAASRSYRQMFPAGKADGRNLPFSESNAIPCDGPTLQLLQNVLSQNIVVEDYEVELDVPDRGKRRMLLNARKAADRRNGDAAVLVALEDVALKSEAETPEIASCEKQDTLLAEVHHRVANSLQIVASILLLKARAVKSEETRHHLRDVQRRLVSVAAVQRQLSVARWGNEVELGPYLAALCESLADSMVDDRRAVTITATAAHGKIRSEDAVSFGLIVTELVINSLKHGFPEGREGHIAIAYVTVAAGWRLTVSDDGLGRPAVVHGGSVVVGLGTGIVELLARSLNARVEIAPAGPGAMTTIIHPA